MAITRLQRRQKKNRLKAIEKKRIIKDLLACPVIKNIDITAMKAEFEKKSAEREKIEKKAVVEEKTMTKAKTIKMKEKTVNETKIATKDVAPKKKTVKTKVEES